MKRRNFLKLPLYAGFAAVFGVKLRAEPVPAVKITEGEYYKDFGTPMHGQSYYKKDYPDLYEACFPDQKDWPIVFFCDDLG